MARAPLVLETHGKIQLKKVNGTPTAFARYRDVDGKTRKVQRTGRTLPMAEANLKEALKNRHLETDPDAALTRESTIDQLIDEWLGEARASGRYAPATLRTYSERAKARITPAIGSVRLSETSVSMLDRFVKLTIRNHGKGTARTIRTVLVNTFDLAVRHGLVALNYARNTAPVPTTKTTPEAPSLETVRAIIAHLKLWDAALLKKKRTTYLHDLTMMYVATGARTAEILALEWSSIDLESLPARVSIEATMIVNEAGKLERQKFTKTDSGMRRLALPDTAVNMLHERRVDSYNQIVFPSATGTHRWPHNLRRDWREALEGTPWEGITPTSFRKAVATHLRDELGIEVARDQLGHSDERVTKQHYAERVSDAPDASKALNLFFQSAE